MLHGHNFGRSEMSEQRLLLIANKWYEADPLVGVWGNVQARSPEIEEIRSINCPGPVQNGTMESVNLPRMTAIVQDWNIEIWCIQDLMNPKLSHSNTSEKARVLPIIFNYGEAPKFVIAFGTAATPGSVSQNGCVTCGSKTFLYDPWKGVSGSESNWQMPAAMNKVINSTISDRFFDRLRLNEHIMMMINDKIIRAANNPPIETRLIHDSEGVAISAVNITNSADFEWADREAIQAAATGGITRVLSVETTHGLIRVLSEAPFIFLSGITDRVGYFAQEAGYGYRQKFIAAHNAAVAASWLVPELIRSA